MPERHKIYYDSAVGMLEIIGTTEVIKEINFVDADQLNKSDQTDTTPIIEQCIQQLGEYFKGERKEFSLTLDPDGTEFQRSVWQYLLNIPFGQTASYLDVAKGIGNEKAVRAVGAANGQNPLVVVVPCHRIIGSNGKLVGYSGGMWRKKWLLKHEGLLQEEQLLLF